MTQACDLASESIDSKVAEMSTRREFVEQAAVSAIELSTWSPRVLSLGRGSMPSPRERAGDLGQMRPWESLFVNGYVAWSWADGKLRVTAIP